MRMLLQSRIKLIAYVGFVACYENNVKGKARNFSPYLTKDCKFSAACLFGSLVHSRLYNRSAMFIYYVQVVFQGPSNNVNLK